MIEQNEDDCLQGLARRARDAFRERGERGVLVVRGSTLSYNNLRLGDDGSEAAAEIRELLASYDPTRESVLHYMRGGRPTTRVIRIAYLH